MARKTEAKPVKTKVGRLVVWPGKPVEFVETADAEREAPIDSTATAIAETIAQYRSAATKLLGSKFSDQREVAPVHLRSPTNVLIFCCKDGVIVRYDPATEGEGIIRAGTSNLSLAEAAPKFSDGLIHLPDDPSTYDPGPDGVRFQIGITNKEGARKEVALVRLLVFAKAALPDGFELLGPTHPPPALARVDSEFDMQMHGVLVPMDELPNPAIGDMGHFIAHRRIRLAAGWYRIEIYPLLEKEYWNPSHAAMWAELDLLAAIAERNILATKLKQLDGRGEARKQSEQLLAEFQALLEGLEEPLHQFLKAHPELLCPTSDKSWSKMAFGKRVSDFVFREPHNDYLLVEIESPICKLFRKDGQPRHELIHAINQTHDWIRHIEDNRETVERDSGLNGISTNPRTLVVIGRSADLTDENRRTLTTIQNQHPKLRIQTYDDVLISARQNLERILGPFQIQSDADVYYYTAPNPLVRD